MSVARTPALRARRMTGVETAPYWLAVTVSYLTSLPMLTGRLPLALKMTCRTSLCVQEFANRGSLQRSPVAS